MSDLIRQFRDRRDEGIRTGVVQAVSTAEGLDVLIGGGLVTGLQFLDSYTAPGIGDVVAVLPMPGRMFVLGKYGVSGGNLGPNLLPNPGFEFGLTGDEPSGWFDFWSTGNTGVDWLDDEAQAHSSGASAEYTLTGLVTGELRRLGTIEAMTVAPGLTYRLGGWFRGSVADPNTEARITVVTGASPPEAEFFAGGTSADIASMQMPSVWTELSGLRTVPAGHFYMRVYFAVIVNAGSALPTVYLDDVSLREQI